VEIGTLELEIDLDIDIDKEIDAVTLLESQVLQLLIVVLDKACLLGLHC